MLKPVLEWAQHKIDARGNGILLNWYDGTLGHYIGKHRDSTVNLVQGAPIVMVSFGDKRPMRFRPWNGAGYTDIRCENGGVIVLPWETNLRWQHEMPKSKSWHGKRISMTIRAFQA
jgi:alkylated DNA repair dioxygenase AlkB